VKNCEGREECMALYKISEEKDVPCYYSPITPKQIKLDLIVGIFDTTRIFLFSLIYICMCIPCCFAGGMYLVTSGIFEWNTNLMERLRCDNTMIGEGLAYIAKSPQIDAKLL